MRGSSDSTSYLESTKRYIFPRRRSIRVLDDKCRLCSIPNCGSCSLSPEFVILHYECHDIFIHEATTGGRTRKEALDLLWVVGSFRKPWRKAPELHLPLPKSLYRSIIRRLENGLGLPWLSKLPAELLLRVWKGSSGCIFWRAITIIHLVSIQTSSRPFKIPLRQVYSWERGKEVETTTSMPGYIRLTIDGFGLRRVERLTDNPRTSQVDRNLAFIVQEESKLEGCLIYIKVYLSMKLSITTPISNSF